LAIPSLRSSFVPVSPERRLRITHHGVGIMPTVPVPWTSAGLAAGRDESLVKAIAVMSRGAA
jgi:hypothetical protein